MLLLTLELTHLHFVCIYEKSWTFGLQSLINIL